ncbi:MAG TPA: hypothetical protein DEB74_16355 [Lachnospiraceae bacterium]|nr:hypothetical protein [Lachnospiraceae bacterium]
MCYYRAHRRAEKETFFTCLEAGKIYGIIGDNGKGKSTFIRLIAGLCIPDSGLICFSIFDEF